MTATKPTTFAFDTTDGLAEAVTVRVERSDFGTIHRYAVSVGEVPVGTVRKDGDRWYAATPLSWGGRSFRSFPFRSLREACLDLAGQYLRHAGK